MLMVWFGKCVGHQPATSQPSPASHHQPPPATTNNAHSLLSCLLSVGESRNPLIPERSLTCCLSFDFDSRSSECAGSRKGNIKQSSEDVKYTETYIVLLQLLSLDLQLLTELGRHLFQSDGNFPLLLSVDQLHQSLRIVHLLAPQ